MLSGYAVNTIFISLWYAMRSQSSLLDASPSLGFPAAAAPSVPSAAPARVRAQTNVLNLSDGLPIGRGSERIIYEHPNNPGLLLKILDRSQLRSRKRQARWHTRYLREGEYRLFLTEFSEYIAASARAGGNWREMPIAGVSGVIHTSLGMALVVEKIIGEDGSLAPTLEQIAGTHGFTIELKHALDAFFQSLADHHIIFNDVGPSNIVYGRNSAGRLGFYLIDGFGLKQCFPLYAWSQQLNRRRLERKYVAMLARMAQAAA